MFQCSPFIITLSLLLLSVCVISISLYSSHYKNGTSLIFLQIISRHGDRAPIFKYPNDPNADFVWPDGIGKLTMLGKKQQFMVGKLIRSMYKDFITSNPNEIKALSSGSDRCIRSAQAHLAGLYEPDPKWVFHESLKWQPIPVAYTSEKEDKVLTYRYSCPKVTKEVKKLTSLFDEGEYKDMLENLTIRSGMNMTSSIYYSFPNVLLLFDTLAVQKIHKLVIPEWAEYYWKDLEELLKKCFFALNSSPTMQRLRSGSFIETLTNMMSSKLNGQLPQQKVQLYCTHDMVLGTLLSALGLSAGTRPPYSSALLVELHKSPKNEHFVRFLYLNSSTPELGEQESHVLKLNGCSELCPFGYFKNFIKEKIPVDLEKECQVNG